MNQSFVFVLNLVDFEGEVPAEVIPRYYLRRADTIEIGKIKETFSRLVPMLSLAALPQECLVHEDPPTGPDSRGGYTYEYLPQESWRYWIITFEGYGNEIENLKHAVALLKNDLELGFTIYEDIGATSSSDKPSGHAVSWHWPPLISYYVRMPPGGPLPVISLNSAALGEIRSNYALVTDVLIQHEHIRKSLERFYSLKSLPSESDLIVIGLFSVIESLISHAPDPKDPTDSLTRQIRSKIKLLAKRFDRPLEYAEFFDSRAKVDTIWSNLYEYRSKIVHGSHVEISKDLPILRSKENIVSFLRETVKLLLLFALKEPVLLIDLQSC